MAEFYIENVKNTLAIKAQWYFDRVLYWECQKHLKVQITIRNNQHELPGDLGGHLIMRESRIIEVENLLRIV